MARVTCDVRIICEATVVAYLVCGAGKWKYQVLGVLFEKNTYLLVVE